MRTVLLVEDEVVIALAASMALEDEGYRVIIAGDGEDGLAKARAERPDVIVTDYMMPRMDGVAMIEALRREGVTTPVVVATSIGESMIPQTAAYDAYLAKPFVDAELMAAIEGVLKVDRRPTG